MILGGVLKALGRLEEAAEAFALAVERNPGSAAGHTNLGGVLNTLGRFEAAIGPLRRAAELDPSLVEAQAHLATALKGLGETEAAAAAYGRAAALRPDQFDLHALHGAALAAVGRNEEAATAFGRAVELKPDYVEGHLNLGNLLMALGRAEGAAAAYEAARALRPDWAETHAALGRALQIVGRLDEAVQACSQAIARGQTSAAAHVSLGAALAMAGRVQEADAAFRQALAIEPLSVAANSNRLFTLNYDPDAGPEVIFQAYRDYDARVARPAASHANAPTGRGKLKIGYVSPDFRAHSTRHFVQPLFEGHDRSAFTVFAYSQAVRDDEVTELYRAASDAFVEVDTLSDEQLAQRIAADGIDILVDLAGHTNGSRLGAFALKPAPVSVAWLGTGYTTGLSAIDYILTDATMAPEGSEGLFSEAPWRLPVGYVFRPGEAMGEVGPLPAETRGYVTFGSLTRAIRINAHTIRAWSEILRRVPGSRLVINSASFQHASMQAALAAKFAMHGIGAERLEIGLSSPAWKVLNEIDVSLDCFPHNSGTTLFESLYMGVPFVTLAGRPSVGRIGASILTGLGRSAWIAHSQAGYVDAAANLASDLPALAKIREGLRAEMQASPLMDEAGFVRAVEDAYRTMWERR